MDLKQALTRVLEKEDLQAHEAESVMDSIMSGQATPAQIGAFLVALRLKGETTAEVTGFARAMRRNAVPVRPQSGPLLDTCGTGGDGRSTFNISTTAAFVVAGTGLKVAKHGNRSVSSRCGSADVLKALGVNIELSPQDVADCIDQVGIGFLYAPRLHPAMKHAVGPRREMGVRTVFNILGPLTNPAGAQSQILGVYEPQLTEMMAQVLGALGSQGAMVVHGADGLDELSTTGANQVSQLKDGQVRTFVLSPQDTGLPRASLADLRGGEAQQNARISQEVLAGKAGPQRDIVLLNAAAALVTGGATESLAEGLRLAALSIDSGAALAKLEELIAFSSSRGNGHRAASAPPQVCRPGGHGFMP